MPLPLVRPEPWPRLHLCCTNGAMVCVGCCRSASFDEGGARGLLLNNLMVKTRLGPALPAPSIRGCRDDSPVLPCARACRSVLVYALYAHLYAYSDSLLRHSLTHTHSLTLTLAGSHAVAHTRARARPHTVAQLSSLMRSLARTCTHEEPEEPGGWSAQMRAGVRLVRRPRRRRERSAGRRRRRACGRVRPECGRVCAAHAGGGTVRCFARLCRRAVPTGIHWRSSVFSCGRAGAAAPLRSEKGNASLSRVVHWLP